MLKFKAFLFSFTFCGALLLLSSGVQAKDLANRLGIGFSNQFHENLPSLAVKYYSSTEMAFSAALGVDTQKDNSRFGFLVKMYRSMGEGFMEENLNFYMGGGAGIISVENSGDNNSGFELMGFTGAEFFLPGLDSLGFMFEAGVGVTSISSHVRFRTVGGVNAGMVFYF